MSKNKTEIKINSDKALAMYETMLMFRRFEERVGLAYTRRKFSGFCHLHIGQEALAVGVQSALRSSDYMITGYRSHTQAIGKGIPPSKVLAELFGKVEGCSRGKGGSMHMFSAKDRFLGGHGIVGGQVPLAAGVGFAIKYRKEDDICVCYIGDAAINQGAFHEALNMMQTWSLPVLVIIENNRYGMGTDIHRTTSIDKLSKRALAYDMASSEVDAMNVNTTFLHVEEIVSKMRKDKKPHLLDAICYRYRGHSVSDPGNYRTKDEVQLWMEKDPIKQQARYLLENKVVTQEQLDALDEKVKSLVDQAEKFADDAPNPDESEIWQHVYA